MHLKDQKKIKTLLIGLMLSLGANSFAYDDDWPLYSEPATNVLVHITPATRQALNTLIAKANGAIGNPQTSPENLKGTKQTMQCALALVNAIDHVRRHLGPRAGSFWSFVAAQVDQARSSALSAEEKAVTEPTRSKAKAMANEFLDLRGDWKKYIEDQDFVFVPELVFDDSGAATMAFPATKEGKIDRESFKIYGYPSMKVNLNTCKRSSASTDTEAFLTEEDFVQMLSSQALQVLREKVGIEGVLERANQIETIAQAEEDRAQIGKAVQNISHVLGDDSSNSTESSALTIDQWLERARNENGIR